MKETGLDRIEKELELFLSGVAELRESQKKTDEQLRKTDELIHELRESQKKTESLMNSTFQEIRESQKKTDEQFRKTDEKIEKIWTQLGDLGFVQGQVAEDLFYRNVKHYAEKQGLYVLTQKDDGGATLVNPKNFKAKEF